MTNIAAAIEAEISALRAKHDKAFQADVAKLKSALATQLGRVSGLMTQVAQPIAPAKAPTVSNGNGGHKPKAVKAAKRNRKGKGVIKYRDPSNPSHTWTGFGRAPAWLRGKEAMFAVPPQTTA